MSAGGGSTSSAGSGLRRWVRAYAGAAVAFLLLDALWLGSMAGLLYRPALGPLMRAEPDLVAAALFYLLYLAGLVAFGIRPGESGCTRRRIAARGAFFGLVAYATYDLTNQAVLVGWPWHLTLIDLVWGSIVSACGAMAGHAALPRARA